MDWVLGVVCLVVAGSLGAGVGGPAGGLAATAIAAVGLWQRQALRALRAKTEADHLRLHGWLTEAARRVMGLEQEVAALGAQLDALRRAPPAAASPATSSPQPPDPAKPQAAPAPAPAAAHAAPVDIVPARAVEVLVEPTELIVEPASSVEPTAEARVAPTLADAHAAAPVAPAPAPAARPAAARPSPRPARAPATPLRDRLPPALARLVFGGNAIVKAGVAILFLGLAFLLRYTAERVTVPLPLRYAGVAATGVALLALGWRLRRRVDAAGGTGYGLILQGAGVGVLYLTSLAAVRLDPLLAPAAAFAFMAAVAGLGAVLAVMQDAPWLALVAVAEGFAAPVLVSTGSTAYAPLLSYLAILDAGILAMAWFRAWRPLNLVGAVATFALAGGWAKLHYVAADRAGVQAFLLLFFALFTSTGVLFARRALAAGDAIADDAPLARRAADALARVGRVDSTLTFGVPLAAFSLQYLLVRDTHWGPAWAAAGFAALHLALSFALGTGGTTERARRYALLSEAHAIVGTIFVTLAIPLALQGVWTGATWAIEAAGMYWLGARQRRVYARAFALVVMAGAAARLLHGLSIDTAPGTPALAGSALGMAMLAVALAAMDVVRRRVPQAGRTRVEAIGATVLPFGAALASAAFAGMVAPIAVAGAASAWIAFASAALAARLAAPALRAAAGVLHATALLALALALHPLRADAPPAAWPDALAALAIGVALLATGALGLRGAWGADARPRELAPRCSLAGGVGLVAGAGVLAASLLFVLTPAHAGLAWPWLGVAALFVGARVRHPGLAVAAFGLQLAAGIAIVGDGPPIWGDAGADAAGVPSWAGPLVLAIAGLVAGDTLRAAAASPGGRRHPAAWHGRGAQWTLVLWALGWWIQACVPALLRELWRRDHTEAHTAVLVLWIAASALAAEALARRRDWRVLGQATLVALPAWAGLALAEPLGEHAAAPSAHAGLVAWPIALAAHLALLRRQARWRPDWLASPQHVAGFWLFAALAARECAIRLGALGAPDSAWGQLATMLVPAVLLAALAQPGLQRRWPIAERREAYLVVAAAPLALWLAAWLWIADATPGDAAPLPYVPVLNPLEVGLGLALVALASWLRALPGGLAGALPPAAGRVAAGATALALVTGAVLRACHHYAGIAWDEPALWASTLAQAALSVTWAVIGVGGMLAGHARARRDAWIAGAALLAVVVAKLFLVELADHGSVERIVSFIVVGVLMLVVGYFAPIPPRRADGGRASPEPGVLDA
ncbi:MAG: DUF2339 domain-containing protein [Burkholderiaceae bacterium]